MSSILGATIPNGMCLHLSSDLHHFFQARKTQKSKYDIASKPENIKERHPGQLQTYSQMGMIHKENINVATIHRGRGHLVRKKPASINRRTQKTGYCLRCDASGTGGFDE
jgi:hypothetical protein